MHAETIDALIEQVQDAANNTGDSDYDPVMLGFTDGLNEMIMVIHSIMMNDIMYSM